MASSNAPRHKVVATHRKARFDYDVLDKVEAGLVLQGSEVKALREGKGNLVDAYVTIKRGQARLMQFEISPYSHDHSGEANPRRTRGLLLHAAEIRRLEAKVAEKGLTLVPLQVYFKGPWAKVEVGLCRGRRTHDKRQVLKQKADRREMDQAMRRR